MGFGSNLRQQATNESNEEGIDLVQKKPSKP